MLAMPCKGGLLALKQESECGDRAPGHPAGWGLGLNAESLVPEPVG